jgi:hypothetical protein
LKVRYLWKTQKFPENAGVGKEISQENSGTGKVTSLENSDFSGKFRVWGT